MAPSRRASVAGGNDAQFGDISHDLLAHQRLCFSGLWALRVAISHASVGVDSVTEEEWMGQGGGMNGGEESLFIFAEFAD